MGNINNLQTADGCCCCVPNIISGKFDGNLTACPNCFDYLDAGGGNISFSGMGNGTLPIQNSGSFDDPTLFTKGANCTSVGSPVTGNNPYAYYYTCPTTNPHNLASQMGILLYFNGGKVIGWVTIPTTGLAFYGSGDYNVGTLLEITQTHTCGQVVTLPNGQSRVILATNGKITIYP